MRTEERRLPLFPLGRVVIFPGQILKLHIFEERYKAMIGACHRADEAFGVLLIRAGHEVGAPADPEEVGCTARILELEPLPEGRLNIVTAGERRFRLLAAPEVAPEGFLVGPALLTTAEDVPPDVPAGLPEQVAQQLQVYADLLRELAGREVVDSSLPVAAHDAVSLSFQVAAALHVAPAERQQLLELDDAVARLMAELTLLSREIPLVRRELQMAKLVASAPGQSGGIGPFSPN